MNAAPSQQTPSGGSDDRLVRLLRSGWTPFADEITAIMADAATQIESLMSRRKEWKCTVGNEDFVTDQENIAQDWRNDGLDVVSYFVLNAERIHGGAGQSNKSKTPPPLDDASCCALFTERP